MDASFWIGLVLAIPLSIAGNMMTPRAQQWLSQRSSTRRHKRHERLVSEFEQVRKFADDRARFNTYLLTVVLAATFVGSAVAIASGAVWAVAYVTGSDQVLFSFGQVIGVLGAIFISKVCVDAMRVSARVSDFQAYKASVEAELGRPIDAQQVLQADSPASGGPAA